jgi:hypothetical protein
LKIGKHMYQYGEDPALKDARRSLEKIIATARENSPSRLSASAANPAASIPITRFAMPE